MHGASKAVFIGLIATPFFFSITSATAAPDAVAGRKFAQSECGGCHVVYDKSGKRPATQEPGKPPHFQAIAQNPRMTDDKLRETLRLPHGTMAELVISERDTLNVIAYINSLR